MLTQMKTHFINEFLFGIKTNDILRGYQLQELKNRNPMYPQRSNKHIDYKLNRDLLDFF